MLKKSLTLGLAVTGAILVSALTLRAADPVPEAKGEKRVTPTGLTIIDVAKPEKFVAQAGDTVWVHYTGRLQATGAKFDSSFDRNEPISFTLGQGSVIKGWDEGLQGMKVGDKRQLIIPPALAYGDKGAGETIPAGATLVFDLELVGLYRPEKL